eukprot:CAMPEP_0177572040 /NCGR_PEP_ID=MMETSP0369-20130122/77753_1 /TAXON_ID=447022 ORGANISM="Scrippsiella hangoei-like, Strain SHHI-4" /NCGR_SAMPLE_ID=MMETSP0369 /ASSEMBLY_ACC=CAM_ASM_000364 /LENGTH=135 /DNA_ID=CAMNT_0019060001 /DNA_START=63 /DNA_END=471 /DNA_ORIENTATION=-
MSCPGEAWKASKAEGAAVELKACTCRSGARAWSAAAAALLLLLENAEGQTVDAQLEMAVNLARDAGLHLGEHVGGLLILVPGGDRHQVLADRPAVVKVWRAVDLLLVDLPAVHKDPLHAGGLRIREVDGVAPAID